ncbi:MAG TPA: YkvA family protein [Rhizomicrobium sp.]|nr:YkvA family protein [Rhizomicrobium sp.]
MKPDPELFDIPVIPLPVLASTHARHARIVRDGFWRKLLKLAGRVPFTEDLAAAYFCVIDPQTPSRVRGVVLVALAWFVVPASVMPEWLIVAGLTDDAAVLALAVGMVRKHIKERHYVRARAALGIPEPIPDEQIWG